MARIKIEERFPRRPWLGVPRPLPVKYHYRAVVPCQLTTGDDTAWEYVCEGGERVRFDYRGASDNSDGDNTRLLEKECQDIYGMPFADVEAVWKRRIGRLDGWWNVVHMIKVDATEGV